MSKFRSVLVLPTVALMMAAAGVQAHSKLVRSTPAANATVAASSTIELRYDEKLGPRSRIELFMTHATGKPGGRPTPIGVATSVGGDGRILIAKPQKPLARGSYLIAWQVIAADGVRTDGTVRFFVR